jgi:uncharacterized protein with NRDE domain
MCTIILFHQCREDWPLLVAVNRDERLDRPAAPPRLTGRSPRVWAGIDREAGGTWLGVNDAGLVVGVANTARGQRERARRSRGLLVMDLLGERDAQAAAGRLASQAASDYLPCRVLVADPQAAFVGSLESGVDVQPLAAGHHVLTNAAPGEPEEPRRAEVVRLLGVMGPPEAKSIPELKQILARHAPVPERSVCLHRSYFGTRSASIIAVGGRRAPLYLHAEGPPCRAEWTDVSPARGEIRVVPRREPTRSKAARRSPRAGRTARRRVRVRAAARRTRARASSRARRAHT